MAISRSIPLIRAASVTPMLRWLDQSGHDSGPYLERAGLGWVPDNQPILPIPLRGAVGLLMEIARSQGPAVPHRIVEDRGIYEIGPIGALGLAGPTIRAGLHNIAVNMPRHCTHEIFTAQDCDGFLRVSDGWAMDIGDIEARHFVQQYVAALVQGICLASTPVAPHQFQVSLVPHPIVGLSHLKSWLGASLQVASEGPLKIEIPDEIADRLMPEHLSAIARASLAQTWERLRNGETFAASIATLVSSMLPFAVPSIDAIAGAAGVSPRTLRRRLKEEGTALSDIVDRTRAEMALERLRNDQQCSVHDLARELGYSHQGALTRAVKRWTGKTPTGLRLQADD